MTENTQPLNTVDQLIMLTELKKKIDGEISKRKAAWQKAARPKQRDTAVLGDDALGTVGMVKARESWKLKDEAAAIKWAQQHKPDLLDYSPRIRPADLTALLKKPVDANGEIIPGFELVKGEPYAQVRTEADAAELIEDALRTGRLDLRKLLELEPAKAEPTPEEVTEDVVAEEWAARRDREEAAPVVLEGEVLDPQPEPWTPDYTEPAEGRIFQDKAAGVDAREEEAGEQLPGQATIDEVLEEAGGPVKLLGRHALDGVLLAHYGFTPDRNTLEALAELDDQVAADAVKVLRKLDEEGTA